MHYLAKFCKNFSKNFASFVWHNDQGSSGQIRELIYQNRKFQNNEDKPVQFFGSVRQKKVLIKTAIPTLLLVYQKIVF